MRLPRMTTRWLLVVVVAITAVMLGVIASNVKGDQPQTPPAEQDHPKASPRSRREIDHLVPIDPYYGHPVLRKYAELYSTLLQVPGWETKAAVMVYRPSFEPEECLVIYETEEKRQRYTLIYTRADRNIWYSMPENRDEEERRKRPERVKVTHHEAPLPPYLARRVGKLWERMLAGVRYPGPEFDGSGIDDATVIELRYTRKFGRPMYGEARSPSLGAPKLLVDLGRALIDYASIAEPGRANVRQRVEAKCQALEEYLAKKTGG
jgi:hypothetical protein